MTEREMYTAWCAILHIEWHRDWSKLTIAEIVAKIRS